MRLNSTTKGSGVLALGRAWGECLTQYVLGDIRASYYVIRKTPEEKSKILCLRKQGLSYAQIGEKFSVTPRAINYICKKAAVEELEIRRLDIRREAGVLL